MWAQKLKESNEIPTWFNKFLTTRYQTLETVADLRASSAFHLQSEFDGYQYSNVNARQSEISSSACQLCPIVNIQFENAQDSRICKFKSVLNS